MFLLVPAYPGSPGQKAVKQLCVCVCYGKTFRVTQLIIFGQHNTCRHWRLLEQAHSEMRCFSVMSDRVGLRQSATLFQWRPSPLLLPLRSRPLKSS